MPELLRVKFQNQPISPSEYTLSKPKIRLVTLLTLAFVALILQSCARLESLGLPIGNRTATPEASAQVEPTLPATALQPTPTAHTLQGTVSLWHSWDEQQVPALLELIAAFQESHPGVLFDVLYVPAEDMQARYEAAVRDGIGPAIILGPAEWGPGLFAKDLAADLTDLVSPELAARINPAALAGGQYQNAMIGLPYAQKGAVLYRNRKIIPQRPDSFDKLVNLAQDKSKGDVLGAILDRSLYFAGGHLYGLGGSLMNEDGSPAFNSPQGVAWLELLKSFESAGPTDYFTDNDINLFEEGRVGIITDGTWDREALAEAIGPENLVIDPWPPAEGGPLAGFVQTDNLYLNSKASGSQREASWAFMDFILSDQGQQILAQHGYIPVIQGLQADDPLVSEAMQALAGGQPYPINPNMGIYLTVLDGMLRSVFEGSTEPAQALQRAEGTIKDLLAGPVTPVP